MGAGEFEAAFRVRFKQHGKDEAPEQPREHPDRQEVLGPSGDPAPAIGGKAAARHDHMDVRVMGHRRAPGVHHRGDANARAEVLGIGGNPKGRLRRGLEQDAIVRSLVLIGDVRNGRGQRVSSGRLPRRGDPGPGPRCLAEDPGCALKAFAGCALWMVR